MNTKNILKTLALAMLLVPACNKSEIANNENAEKKGFALPVTVNVTREGDNTKATYTDNGDGTGSLGFSTGDKLFVRGNYNSGKKYAGTLDYVSATGKFSGTIYTQNEWENSADALFSSAESIYATLLPAGYDSYNFLSIDNNGTTEVAYDDRELISRANAFVASATAKETGVEQLSWERAGSYSDGFALAPRYAVLNFTISGLTAGAKDVTLQVTDGNAYSVTGSVTPNASGVATFAVGVPDYTNIQDVANNLTIGSSNFTLPSNIDFYKGKIYNINRAAPAATSLSELKTAINGGIDCSSYIGWEVNSAGAIAASSVSGTKIGYVALVSTSDVDAGVSGSRILVIASADAAADISWGSQGTSRGLTADDLNGYSKTNTLQGSGSGAHPAANAAWNYSAAIPSGGATPAHWFMPTKKQWENMRDVYSGGNLAKRNAMVSAYGIDGSYWTSTEDSDNKAYRFSTNGSTQSNVKSNNYNVRSIFAY